MRITRGDLMTSGYLGSGFRELNDDLSHNPRGDVRLSYQKSAEVIVVRILDEGPNDGTNVK